MQHRIYWLACILSGALLAGCTQKNDNTEEFQVVGINDFHGALKAPGNGKSGGVESMATLINELRKDNKNTIVVGAGDIVGASPLLSSMFHDEPTIEAMNLLRMEATAVGNHEFDKGKAELLRKQNGGCHPDTGCVGKDKYGGARFQYLAANVINTDTGKTLFPSYYIKTFDNVKIAFIGLTLKGTPSIVTPKGTEGLTFKDEIETINQQVKVLQNQGIKNIGVLIHEGAIQQVAYNQKNINHCDNITGPIIDIVNQLDPEVDFVISGHTHQAYNCKIGKTPVISAQSNGMLVSLLKIDVNTNNKLITNIVAKNIPVEIQRYRPDPILSHFIHNYETIALPIANKIVGSLTANLTRSITDNGESTLGKVISDAQLYAASSPENGGAEIAFMNSGGIRDNMKAGQIKYADVFAVQPFSNMLVTQSMTGAQIKQVLEQQWNRSRPQIMSVSKGFYYEWDNDSPAGKKVVLNSLKLNGHNLDMNKTYRVVANEFLATGGSKFTVFKQGKNKVYSVPDNEAMTKYFNTLSPINLPSDIRIKKLN